MKVLLKSLKELKREYGIEKRDGYFIIDNTVIDNGMIKLFGKVEEAYYEKEIDSYIIDDYDFSPNLIKGEVIGYTIKRLSDGKKCTFSI